MLREEEFSLHISMKDRPKALSVCHRTLSGVPYGSSIPFYGFSCMCQRREQDPGAGV